MDESGILLKYLSVQVLCRYVGDRKVDMKTAVSTFTVACHHMLGRNITYSEHMNMAKDHTYM